MPTPIASTWSATRGLIQCLREAEQTDPIRAHNAERKAAAKAGLLPPPKKGSRREGRERSTPHPRPPPFRRSGKSDPGEEPKAPKVKPPRRGGKRKAAGDDGGNPPHPARRSTRPGKGQGQASQQQRQQSILRARLENLPSPFGRGAGVRAAQCKPTKDPSLHHDLPSP